MLNSMFAFVSKYVWSISFLMLAIISFISLLPLETLPIVPGSDKTHHLISYALIAIPISFVRPKYWLIFLLLVVVWSGVIEVIQPFVNRYGDWVDLLANFVGALMGIMVCVSADSICKSRLV